MLAWHYYVRENQIRHWMDHRTPGDGHWYDLDRAGRRRVLTLLRYVIVGGFGTGPVRPISAYQEYAGIDFGRRTATDATLTGQLPAIRPADQKGLRHRQPAGLPRCCLATSASLVNQPGHDLGRRHGGVDGRVSGWGHLGHLVR
ncbi:hypothetical protein ACIG87_25825 [Micromonospora sp. NPDC051925]|uniref:hypothetical protein n=1 Tax=Micromonospora sp. NPDC051925 TaxID=3364288 RepID=UPI0037C8DC76